GRACMLARSLQRRYGVEIAGPLFGEGLWAPLAMARDVPIKSLSVRGPMTNAKVLALRNQLDGDVVYASKPRFPSYGVGLIEKLAHRSPVVLDIDDWETGFIRDARRARTRRRDVSTLLSDVVYDTTVALAETLTGLADGITVSNTFLRNRFGGVIVWHGRDTEAFRPDRVSRETARAAHGIRPEEQVVMVLGSPGPPEGAEELTQAGRGSRASDVPWVRDGRPSGQG